MSTTLFLSGLEPLLKNDGTVNTAGTVEFYVAGSAFATANAVYADSGLLTSLGAIVTLNSAGTIQCYLNGDYDIKIKDSGGALIRSAYNINPSPTSTSTDPNLISNGSFENANLTNWTLFEWNVGTTVVDNADQTHGAYSVKFVSAGAGGGYITSGLFSCNPTTNILTSFSLKSSVANIRNIVTLRWYDKLQAFLSSTTLLDDSATNSTSWVTKSNVSTPPANAVFVAIKLTGGDSSMATAGTTRFDNIFIIEDPGSLVHATNSIAETITGNKTFTGVNTFTGANIYTHVTAKNVDYLVTAADAGSILGISTVAARLITLPDAMVGGFSVIIMYISGINVITLSRQVASVLYVDSSNVGVATYTLSVGAKAFCYYDGANWFIITNQSRVLNNPVGGDMGIGTLNVSDGFYVAGVKLSPNPLGALDSSKLVNTVYTAATDLLVHATVASNGTGTNTTIFGYTDTLATPTTLYGTATSAPSAPAGASFTMVVNKGNKWRVVLGGDSTVTTATIRVVSLGT